MPEQSLGDQVGAAHVKLGLDRNPFQDSLKSAQVTFDRAMLNMGRGAKVFSTALGTALGIGVSKAVGEVSKIVGGPRGPFIQALTEQQKLARLALRAGMFQTAGGVAADVGMAVDDFRRDYGVPVSRAEVIDLMTILRDYGIRRKPEQDEAFRRIAALSRISEKPIDVVAEEFLKVTRGAGGPIPPGYGIIQPPGTTAKQNIELFEKFADIASESLPEFGKLSGEQLKRFTNRLKEVTSGIAEGVIEIALGSRDLGEAAKGAGKLIKDVTGAVIEGEDAAKAARESSQHDEQILERIIKKQQEVRERTIGLTDEEIAKRGGMANLTPDNIMLTDEERKRREGATTETMFDYFLRQARDLSLRDLILPTMPTPEAPTGFGFDMEEAQDTATFSERSQTIPIRASDYWPGGALTDTGFERILRAVFGDLVTFLKTVDPPYLPTGGGPLITPGPFD